MFKQFFLTEDFAKDLKVFLKNRKELLAINFFLSLFVSFLSDGINDIIDWKV
jgi:hypothetical protein